MTLKIFIGHSSKDDKLVNSFTQNPKLKESEVFEVFDDSEIQPGDSWLERIATELEKCDIFILFWSSAASKSKWVKKEINIAIAKKKRIIPCIIDDTPKHDLLEDVQHLDFSNSDEDMQQLLNTLLLNQPSTQKPFGTKSEQSWFSKNRMLIIGLVLILTLISIFLIVFQRNPSVNYCKSTSLINIDSTNFKIFVANFEDENPNSMTASKRIISSLRKDIRFYSDIVIDSLGCQLKADTIKIVRERNDNFSNELIIWGSVLEDKDELIVNIYFDLLKKTKTHFIKEESNWGFDRSSGPDNLQFKANLAKEVSCVSLFIVGVVRAEQRNFVEAISLFKRAKGQKAIPKEMIETAAIERFLGEAYSYIGNYEEEAKAYTQVLENKDRLEEIHKLYNNRGLAYLNQKKYNFAIADFNMALNLDSTFIKALNNIGIAYLQKGEPNKAVKYFSDLLEIDSNYLKSYNNLGLAYMKLRFHDKAIENFSILIDRNEIPENIKFAAYLNRGIAQIELNNYYNALSDFAQAILIDSNSDEAYYLRGNAFALLEQCDQALANYNMAMVKNPSKRNFYQHEKMEVKEMLNNCTQN